MVYTKQDHIFTCFEYLQSNGEYYEAERNHTENPTPPLNLTFTNFLSQYCYDATWAFALVLNKTIEGLWSRKLYVHRPLSGMWCVLVTVSSLLQLSLVLHFECAHHLQSHVHKVIIYLH